MVLILEHLFNSRDCRAERMTPFLRVDQVTKQSSMFELQHCTLTINSHHPPAPQLPVLAASRKAAEMMTAHTHGESVSILWALGYTSRLTNSQPPRSSVAHQFTWGQTSPLVYVSLLTPFIIVDICQHITDSQLCIRTNLRICDMLTYINNNE